MSRIGTAIVVRSGDSIAILIAGVTAYVAIDVSFKTGVSRHRDVGRVVGHYPLSETRNDLLICDHNFLTVDF